MMRLVALGASNLTRGLSTVVDTARQVWGEPVEVLAALGHGRSYGMRSTVLVRSLPGILECGIWRRLDESPRCSLRALVTDVGNDILYGASVEAILSWVGEVVARLRALGADLTVTDLPLDSIRRLSKARFIFFRSFLFPRCRLTSAEVVDRAEAVCQGIERLASREGLRVFRLRSEWYGLDPVHIRPRFWSEAWRSILLSDQETPPTLARVEPINPWALYLARPERRFICGVEQRRAQPALTTPRGGTVWLY